MNKFPLYCFLIYFSLPSVNALAMTCEDISRTVGFYTSKFLFPNQYGRLRTRGDYLTQTTPPIYSERGVRNFVSMPDEVAALSISDLYRLLNDNRYADDFSNKHGRGISDARKYAAILLARFNIPNLVPGVPLTNEQFALQAKLMDAEIKNIKFAYRMDSRSPEEVKKADGFRPNPQKPAFTIPEAVDPFVDGGANTVSASVQFSNSRLAAAILAGEDPRPIPYSVTARPPPPVVVEGYEYQICDVQGFEVPPSFGMDFEREIVYQAVARNKISNYRKVKSTRKYELFHGNWFLQPTNNAEVEFGKWENFF